VSVLVRPAGSSFAAVGCRRPFSPNCPSPTARRSTFVCWGEDLIAFRDTNGNVGSVDAYCPHRLAPMFYGRNEECGLRCVYRGWKFDVTGKCVEVPNESAHSPMKDKVRPFDGFVASGQDWRTSLSGELNAKW
jgi:phthalate 4,5-dioxygenase oxygenase subunit